MHQKAVFVKFENKCKDKLTFVKFLYIMSILYLTIIQRK